MVLGGDREAVEHDLGRTVGDVVAVAVGDEQQLGRAEQPDAAEPELDAAEPLDVVGEDRPPVEPAVAVGVLEDQDAVAEAEVELLGAVGVGVVLGDPEPPAGVPGHRDRVPHVRLGGEDVDPEPRRDRKPAAASAGGIGRVDDRSVSGGSGKSPPTTGTVNKEYTTRFQEKEANRFMACFRKAYRGELEFSLCPITSRTST